MNYSRLIVVDEVTEAVLQSVEGELAQGVKVFILTKVEALHVEWYEKAKLAKLLHVYVVDGSVSLPVDGVSFIDGDVEPSLLTWLNNHSSFNAAQFRLEHEREARHICVSAGAGTGKTTTMVSRVIALKHLVPQFSFATVAMITFTNEAAIQIRKKLMEQLLHYYQYTGKAIYLEWMEQATGMFIGTIHAFAKQMLEDEAHALQLPRGLTINSYKSRRKWWIEQRINEFRQERPEVYELFEQYPHYQVVKLIQRMMTALQQKSLTAEDIQRLVIDDEKGKLHELIEFVLKRAEADVAREKKAKNSVELSDLISYLQKFKQTGQADLRTKLTYLFVDEFQDTDEMQVDFVVALLRLYKAQLFAVGDVKQSIYRFRGANYTAFEQLNAQLEEGETLSLSLQKNYRSDGRLLQRFNRLFKEWTRRVDKFSFTRFDELVAVRGADEGEFISFTTEEEWIELMREKQQAGESIAVLVRSNHQVNEAVQLLEEHGFFCEADVAGDFYRSSAVREFYLLVRRLTHAKVAKDRFLFAQSSYWAHEQPNWHEHISFEQRAIVPYLDEVEADDKQRWNDWLQRRAPIDALEAIVEQLAPARRYALKFYAQRCQGWNGAVPETVSERAKVEANVRMKEYEMNLQQLLYVLKQQLPPATTSLFDIEQFLKREMATNTELSQLKVTGETVERVRVMTVHKAKGLEFQCVVLPYTDSTFYRRNRDAFLVEKRGDWHLRYKVTLDESQFSSAQFTASMEEEESEIQAEETRMLYVALTRAEKSVLYRAHHQSVSKVDKWSSLLSGGVVV